tara:strand:- start:298 stop:522 length:225 start_codon:yes stop_codon:yes gene_type:complete
MKKFIALTLLLIFSINNSIHSEEVKCKAYQLLCKSKIFIKETKEFQKKGLDQTIEKISKGKDKVSKHLEEQKKK